MSLCPSCAHQIESWQHVASCQRVEDKIPNPSRRRLEEPVVTRATRSATPRATPRVVAPEAVERHENPPPAVTETSDVTETPSDVTKKGGRPKKEGALSAAERQKARRERLKNGGSE